VKRWALIWASLVVLLASCSSSSATAKSSNAPVLDVVTGLYPVAQAIEQIGQSKVNVTDVVPSGENPLTYRLTAADASQVRAANLVVDVGRGFQPSFEAAAAGNAHVLSVGAVMRTSNPYFWLDPNLMPLAISRMASAMEKADPQAAPVFRQGLADLADEVNSTNIDYENTLSTCPRQTIFTANEAFADMARDYGLQNVLVGTGPTLPPSLGSEVQSSGTTTIFYEPWVSTAGVAAAAKEFHLKARQLDTLAGPPPGGWPSHATYINLLEANLGALSRALGCPDTSTGT
jgi:ABC-type Zn uptake system ZnuABC Zn-binding protein ZnuA